MLGELRDDRVDLVVVLVDSEYQALRVLVGRDGQAVEQRRTANASLLALVGKTESPLSRRSPCGH